jgi:SAM-dependent methyltransferase
MHQKDSISMACKRVGRSPAVQDRFDKNMQSRFSKIVDEVEAELRGFDHSSPYFTLLRPNFVDDLMRIRGLHRRGAMLEIGGYPFYFSMCLQRLGVDPTTVDLAPERAQDLIRKHSLRVVTCDIERESLPFKDHSVGTIALCATFEHLRVDPFFALEEMRRVLQPDGSLYLTTPNLYRLGNVVSFALGRGLAFDPIREYGKLRTVGHMGTRSRVHYVRDTTLFARGGIRQRRNRDAGDAKSAWHVRRRSASTPAGNKRRARCDSPASAQLHFERIAWPQ